MGKCFILKDLLKNFVQCAKYHKFFLSFCRMLREYQNSQAILAEKLVGGKLGKQQFVEQEAIIIKRKDECKERIIAINSHLV